MTSPATATTRDPLGETTITGVFLAKRKVRTVPLNPNGVPKSPGVRLTRADPCLGGWRGQHFSVSPSRADTTGPRTAVWVTRGGRTSRHQAGERLWALPVLPLLAPQEISADQRGQAGGWCCPAHQGPSQAGREGDYLRAWLSAVLVMLPVSLLPSLAKNDFQTVGVSTQNCPKESPLHSACPELLL